MHNRFLLQVALVASAFSIPHAFAQSPGPVGISGLCNTGLTSKKPLPVGCQTSTLITPINPENGGPIVDTNWDLANPYPSAAANQPAPNPCVFTAAYLAPAVSQPYYGWYNPNDGLSQWIEPQDGSEGVSPGWYLYRTSFPIPQAQSGSTLYKLEVTGQFLADDYVSAIYLEDPATNETACHEVAAFTSTGDAGSWQPFHISATVKPDTLAYFYFIVYNANSNYNPSGLRVEFTSRYLFPN